MQSFFYTSLVRTVKKTTEKPRGTASISGINKGNND